MLVVVLRFPEVGLKRCLEFLLSMTDPGCEGTCGIDGKGTVVDGDGDARFGLLRLGILTAERPSEVVWFQDELFASHYKSFISPRGSLSQHGTDIQNEFLVVIWGIGIGNLKTSFLYFDKIACHRFSVAIDFAVVIIFIDAREKVAVDDADVVALPDKLYRLIHILNLIIVRVWLAVGSNETVDAEVPVIGLIAEVTAIGPIFVRL